MGAQRIIEVGTCGGYSTIWLARVLPANGELITMEIDPFRAHVAEENIAMAGLDHKVNVVVGPALDTLKALHPEKLYDFAFIDADDVGYCDYFKECKRLVRRGGIIIVDNVVVNGVVAMPDVVDEGLEGVRDLLKWINEDKEIDAVTQQTVGGMGFDGYIYARRL